MGDPGRVEIKLSIGADDVAPARELLGWTDARAARADIWFCDRITGTGKDRALDLFDRHLIVRLRHKFGKDSDTTLKYRGKPPLDLPSEWRSSDDDRHYKIEGDWTGKSQLVSASLDSTVSGHDITSSVGHGSLSVDDLFSADQKAFAGEVGDGAGIEWKSLQPLGPIHALRWEEEDRDDLDHALGGEQWIAGDLLFLELSVRVKFAKAQEWQERFTDWAGEKALGVSAVATTKTEAVLHHFADRLEP
jgi:hypothetical protein